MAVPYYSEGNSDRNATNQHPISPPPGMAQRASLQALESFPDDESGAVEIDEARDEYIATFFAQWGADQELEACCEWLNCNYRSVNTCHLRNARRPKALSLKERALALLQPGETRLLNREQQDVIRQALETLPDE